MSPPTMASSWHQCTFQCMLYHSEEEAQPFVASLMRQSIHKVGDCRVQMSKAHHHHHKRAKATRGSLWDPRRLPSPAQTAGTPEAVPSDMTREDADKPVSMFTVQESPRHL